MNKLLMLGISLLSLNGICHDAYGASAAASAAAPSAIGKDDGEFRLKTRVIEGFRPDKDGHKIDIEKIFANQIEEADLDYVKKNYLLSLIPDKKNEKLYKYYILRLIEGGASLENIATHAVWLRDINIVPEKFDGKEEPSFLRMFNKFPTGLSIDPGKVLKLVKAYFSTGDVIFERFISVLGAFILEELNQDTVLDNAKWIKSVKLTEGGRELDTVPELFQLLASYSKRQQAAALINAMDSFPDGGEIDVKEIKSEFDYTDSTATATAGAAGSANNIASVIAAASAPAISTAPITPIMPNNTEENAEEINKEIDQIDTDDPYGDAEDAKSDGESEIDDLYGPDAG